MVFVEKLLLGNNNIGHSVPSEFENILFYFHMTLPSLPGDLLSHLCVDRLLLHVPTNGVVQIWNVLDCLPADIVRCSECWIGCRSCNECSKRSFLGPSDVGAFLAVSSK